MLSLGVYGDTYKLTILGDYNAITPPPGTPDRYTRGDSYDIASVTPTIGKWGERKRIGGE